MLNMLNLIEVYLPKQSKPFEVAFMSDNRLKQFSKFYILHCEFDQILGAHT